LMPLIRFYKTYWIKYSHACPCGHLY
jgi:hypothetical protein